MSEINLLIKENQRLQRENAQLREQLKQRDSGARPSPAYKYTDGMGWEHDVPEGYHDMGK